MDLVPQSLPCPPRLALELVERGRPELGTYAAANAYPARQVQIALRLNY